MSHERQDAAPGAGQRAADRADELQQRRAELSARKPVTGEDVDRARDALRTARERAAAAHRRAGAQHLAAAERHEQAAGILAEGGSHERAEEERNAARHDREAAVRAEREARADDP